MIKRLKIAIFRQFALILAVSIFACNTVDTDSNPLIDENPSGDTTTITRPTLGGSWSGAWPGLRHDGNPFESDRVIVYSGYSSQTAREDAAGVAEVAIDDVMSVLDVTWADFTFQTWYEKDKIDVFIDFKQMSSLGLSGRAYRDGVLIQAKDSQTWAQLGASKERWRRILQHELTHVAEHLLIGNPDAQGANSVWLREGGANYVSHNQAVHTQATLSAWQSKMANVPGAGNPIAIYRWSDFPQSVIDNNTWSQYYDYFELSTRFLIDPNGHGGSIENLKALYEELGQGVSFRTAFENNFGISVTDFHANWWDLMRAYLS